MSSPLPALFQTFLRQKSMNYYTNYIIREEKSTKIALFCKNMLYFSKKWTTFAYVIYIFEVINLF